MKVNIMPCRFPLKDTEWPLLLKQGIQRCGDEAYISQPQNVDNADVHAFWGKRRRWGKIALERKKPSLIVERAYLGNRFKWHAFGLNDLNGFANFGNQDVPDDRWRKFWRDDMKDWKTDGEYALLIGQVPRDASLRGKNIQAWLSRTAPQAKEIFGKVVFRPHPARVIGNIRLRDVETRTGDLQEALAGAKVVITYSSNTAVDAVMAGVPAIAMCKGSMAWEVSSHTLDEPLFRGDRENWGRKIAYSQWLPSEIGSGAAWDHIRGFVHG